MKHQGAHLQLLSKFTDCTVHWCYVEQVSLCGCTANIHQLLFCYISENVAARVFAVVFNCTCCYQGNHIRHQINQDWILKDYNFNSLLNWRHLQILWKCFALIMLQHDFKAFLFPERTNWPTGCSKWNRFHQLARRLSRYTIYRRISIHEENAMEYYWHTPKCWWH